jgi:hypothetical protein
MIYFLDGIYQLTNPCCLISQALMAKSVAKLPRVAVAIMPQRKPSLVVKKIAHIEGSRDSDGEHPLQLCFSFGIKARVVEYPDDCLPSQRRT